jgi:hypothetical protein
VGDKAQEARQGGDSPIDDRPWSRRDYDHPAAGWGAAKAVTNVLFRERELIRGPHAIVKMNHENGGFDCPGCAWPDDTKGLHLDISRDGSTRRLRGYRALAYDVPAGSAAGYMPEMNVLVGADDYSAQSGQPLMKHIHVRVARAGSDE